MVHDDSQAVQDAKSYLRGQAFTPKELDATLEQLKKELEFGYEPPETTKTFIREYFFGEDVIAETLGDSMHVFLLNIPRLEFAAIIPKGEFEQARLVVECTYANYSEQTVFGGYGSDDEMSFNFSYVSVIREGPSVATN